MQYTSSQPQSNQLNASSGQQQTTVPNFSPQSCQHMTHQIDSYEKNAIQFQLPNAIIWQIKFILSSVNSKKSLQTATQEFQNLSEGFGKDFDKYLLKELIEQIDIQDLNKASKDKSESLKITLLNQEITRASQKPEFLSYFFEIIQKQESTKPVEFVQEVIKRLKLNTQTQILVTLSMLESVEDQEPSTEASGEEKEGSVKYAASPSYLSLIQFFRDKLVEFDQNIKADQMPEYAAHRILFLLDSQQELREDQALRDVKQTMINSLQIKFSQFTPLRCSVHQDISQINCNPDLPSFNILRDGCGLDHLDQINKILQPWEVLLDIGHNSSYMYDYLVKILQDFKNIDEKCMAETILQLSIHHQGKDDHVSKIVYSTFDSNKSGNSTSIKKEPEEKKTQMSWSIDNLARAFRELYTNVNWTKVFESFGEIEDFEVPPQVLDQGLDQKQFLTLIQLFNKCKPQNVHFPLQNLLSSEWKSPALQFTFIKNCIGVQMQKKDKSILFGKLKNKIQTISDLQEIKERGESQEFIDIWQSIDMVERLIVLSESPVLYVRVRKLFEAPLKQLPEYLLLNLSCAKPAVGGILIDELLSILMPIFLGNHTNSSIVLQKLFELNSSLFIRGICELCKHDQRLMNLSRVLDITQEVRDSLLAIVYCEDYNFAVHLGILAGKRDFLHYDVWIQSRIKDVGSPFINALIKYINDHIIIPAGDFVKKNQQLAANEPENFETQKSAILDRSHLTKDKLILTIELLQPLRSSDNEKILKETEHKIKDLVEKSQELFPQHYEPGQNSEAIDAAANEHFQKVFSAEDDEVDAKIEELIKTMIAFKESPEPQEQEIYACMLHGLFDEYRFLHRYPPQYLTKIAKLFGAIIKNRLLDRVLQDIALKFVIEAFRRDGKRQRFGVIVIRSFFEILPQFPKFLEDIYQMRANIEATEPQMMADIARLHHEMMQQNNQAALSATRSETAGEGAVQDSSEDHQNYSGQNIDRTEGEEGKLSSEDSSLLSLNSARLNQEIKSDKQTDPKNSSAKNDPKKGQQQVKQAQQQTQNQQAQNKSTSKNQRQQQSSTPQQQQMTPPISNQAKEFIPSNRNTLQQNVPTGQNQQAKIFVPSNQKQGYNVQQPSQLVDHMSNSQNKFMIQPKQGQQQQPVSASGLNVRSAEFHQRPMSSNTFEKQINTNSKEFMPSRPIDPLPAKNVITPGQVQELLEYKKSITEKIQKATESGGKVRLADLLDDETIKVENEYVEDQIRIICNHTDRGNFKQKIEDLKKFVIKKPSKIGEDGKEIVDEKSARADDHLKWFIHCILTKRLGAQGSSIQQIFVEMIRELNTAIARVNKKSSVINQTLAQASLIFKKCMIIDEEEFMKVTNVAQGQASLLKGYLSSLGSFIGSMTIAKNEPIRSTQIDLKQILIEGFQTKNRRLAVAFVCRILKESQHSRVFTPRNPWIYTLLQILREIYDYSQPLQNKQHHAENMMEIDSLFKVLNMSGSQEVKPHGILQSLENPSSFVDPSVRRELDYIFKKVKMVLPAEPAPPANASDGFQSTQLSMMSGQPSDTELLRQQMSQISRCVTVSSELTQIFTRFRNLDEQMVRRLVGNAVDNSIVEILPPVVDRSVTIALITTRELVLKDFAYDGDYNRVLKAADLIVQNLAGSLALVTCREPLRVSLTTNLKKIFDQHFRCELGLEVKSSQAQSENEQGSTMASIQEENVDSNGFFKSVTEEQITDIAVLASKENLELGCKLIKKEVIDKALKKVREDQAIMSAVENRKQAEERGIRPYRDARIIAQFQELPPQLQPNQNGLTNAQFQVYEDFQKLGQSSREGENEFDAINPIAAYQQTSQNLTSILIQIDQYGLTEHNKNQLIAKIQQMNQSVGRQTETEEEKEDKNYLWNYVKKNLETACKNYDSRNPQGVEPIIQVLSLIVTSYTVENFSKKLLTQVFLQLDVRIFNEVELNILLMSKRIISISEWDKQLATFFKESAVQLPDRELQFFYNFLSSSIVEKKILTKEQVPQLISVIELMSQHKKIGKFCQYILEIINFEKSSRVQLDNQSNQNQLRDFFIKWVVMSYVDDKENQEKQINTLFKDLGTMGIDSDPKLLFSFCKVMVQTSIEKALVFGDGSGEKRPADRLDFRYIDSFVKLIVILLKMFNFNKHEFMTKVLEFIGEVLDEDHRTKKQEFNQRPYHRMLMNILTAVNLSDCFNQKTQRLILFSMADLLQNLSPDFYPAFCFSWLELISHKQFLSHFLSSPPSIPGMQNLGQQQQQQQLQGGNQMGFKAPVGLNVNMVDSIYYEKRCKIKELIVSVFSFLKANMSPGRSVPPAIQAFYHATLRVITVIKQDFPDFLSDFHFHFVNSLPDHCIQLRNIILSACPKNIRQPDPFHEDLKIDLLNEIQQNPRILSNYDNYLSLMNLKDDLENYARTRNPQLIIEICRKMEQSEEIVNGRRRINSNVISAVVLHLANQSTQPGAQGESRPRPQRDTFKQIVQRLNDETRLCFLNAVVNELRYPSRHTFDFSCIILSIQAEAGREIVFEQISQIFLERLQAQGPYPWGLMISFRELIQNPKLEFMKKQYIKEHPQSVANLFKGRLKNFIDFIPQAHRQQILSGGDSSIIPPPGPGNR